MDFKRDADGQPIVETINAFWESMDAMEKGVIDYLNFLRLDPEFLKDLLGET